MRLPQIKISPYGYSYNPPSSSQPRECFVCPLIHVIPLYTSSPVFIYTYSKWFSICRIYPAFSSKRRPHVYHVFRRLAKRLANVFVLLFDRAFSVYKTRILLLTSLSTPYKVLRVIRCFGGLGKACQRGSSFCGLTWLYVQNEDPIDNMPAELCKSVS